MTAYIQEGLQPPKTLPHHFENLVLSMAYLYENDKHGLALEFLGMPAADGNLSFTRTPVAQVLFPFFLRIF
jgi:hypothetical protein